MIDRTRLPVQGEVSELANSSGPLGAAAAMCARLLDLRMKAPSQSVLPRIDKEADDGRFAKRLSGLQPVQTLNEHEAGAVHPYQDR